MSKIKLKIADYALSSIPIDSNELVDDIEADILTDIDDENNIEERLYERKS